LYLQRATWPGACFVVGLGLNAEAPLKTKKLVLAAISALSTLALWTSTLPAGAANGWATVEQLLRSFQRDSSGYPSNFIDYQEMSLRALGKRDWESLSASHRAEFSSTLKALVERRYYPRWKKIFTKGKVALIEETTSGGDVLVKTNLTLGKKCEPLSWRMSERGGTLKVVSLSVRDKDLLDKLKHRIASRQKKAGFEDLLAWMKGRSGDHGLDAAVLETLPLASTKPLNSTTLPE
jgi:hypothetical protein